MIDLEDFEYNFNDPKCSQWNNIYLLNNFQVFIYYKVLIYFNIVFSKIVFWKESLILKIKTKMICNIFQFNLLFCVESFYFNLIN